MGAQWTETTWHGYANYECAGCPFSTLDADVMARHQVNGHGKRAKTAARNVGIEFASEAAAERALAAGLTAEHFAFEPSGTTGYTTKDVERAARDLNPTEEQNNG